MAAQSAWAFRSALKRHAFGWSGGIQAITRLNEALSEITRAAHADPALAGEGAVVLLNSSSPRHW